MRQALVALSFFTAAAIAFVPERAGAQATPKLTVKETILGKLEPNVTKGYTISPDHNHVAVVNQRGEKFVVSLDGKDGEAHEWVVAGSVTFSADSSRLAYVVQEAGKMFVVVDGQKGKPYHEIVLEANLPNIWVAPAGTRFAYRAKNSPDAKIVWVVDGQEGKEFDQVGKGVTWSPDGKRLAYGAEHNKKQFFVIDNAVGGQKEFDRVTSFTWSPDSKRFAYAGVRDKEVIMVSDGKEGKPYVEMSRPLFSPDSTKLAYAATPLGQKPPAGAVPPATQPVTRSLIVINEQEQPGTFERIESNSLVFSPDSKRFAFIAASRDVAPDKLFFVIDGQPTPGYDSVRVGSFIFSPDSKRHSYQVVDRNRPIVVIDGREGRAYDDILAYPGTPTAHFSPDSSKLVYVARRENQYYVVVNNNEGMGYDGIAPNVVFSADAKRMAYPASRQRKQFVVLDGIEGNDFAGLVPQNLVFSGDGKHLAYEAIRGTEPGARPFFVVSGPDAKAPPAESQPHGGTVQRTRLIFEGNVMRALVLKGEREGPRDVTRWEVTVD
jgi:Tol biopolymer transport system component